MIVVSLTHNYINVIAAGSETLITIGFGPQRRYIGGDNWLELVVHVTNWQMTRILRNPKARQNKIAKKSFNPNKPPSVNRTAAHGPGLSILG